MGSITSLIETGPEGTEMIDEVFVCTVEEFDEADKESGIVGAIYESENFKILISYEGSYNKDKQNNEFQRSGIAFSLRPKYPMDHPSVGYNGHSHPYADDCLMSMDDSAKTAGPMDPGKYKEIFRIYDEIFAFARKSFDEILPKYFPKDAKYPEVQYTMIKDGVKKKDTLQ